MCIQCDDLQKKIGHYRGFLGKFDPLTEQRIGGLIADLELRKDSFHKGASIADQRLGT
jgi:hypothetical protein